MQKSYCVKCKKEVNQNVKKCKCGGERFAFGETLKVTDGKITCQCGCSSIKRGMHTDYTDKYVESGACSNCGKAIGIEAYRDNESMMFWGDSSEDNFEKETKYSKRQKYYSKFHKG